MKTLDPALAKVLENNGIDPRDVDPGLLRADRDRYRNALNVILVELDKKTELIAEMTSKLRRYRAALAEVRHDSSIPWAIDTIAERHEIDPAELKAD